MLNKRREIKIKGHQHRKTTSKDLLYTLFFFFLRREPKSLRSDYNKRPAVIMLGIRSLFSTLYTDSFLASQQTESFSLLLLSLSLFPIYRSLFLCLSFSLTHSIFPFFFFFRATSPPCVIFSQQFKLLPQSPPPGRHPPPDVAPGANNFSYIIRTWCTQCATALLLPLYETVFNHVISFIYFILYSFPSSLPFIFLSSEPKTNTSYS